MEQKIDFVITWVDGNDPSWQKRKKQHQPHLSDNQDDSAVRYRSWDNLEHWIQLVYKFAPWVNAIFVITDKQEPDFLKKYDKVSLVDHEDYIPHEYLPTFNSNVIELNIHRIPGLQEQFVLFNDDMFLIDHTSPEDFFVNGKPKDVYGLNIVAGVGVEEVIQNITLNNVSIINKYLSKNKAIKENWKKWFSLKNGPILLRTLLLMPWGVFSGFYEPHTANSHLKSTFETMWELEPKALHLTSLNKFRAINDVNQWLMRYWQLANGISETRHSKSTQLFHLNDGNLEACLEVIESQRAKIICINDQKDLQDFEGAKERINNALITLASKR